MRRADLAGTRPLLPQQWAYDPYARACDGCDTVVGRFGVLRDEQGWRHVLWWPHKEWDGVDGAYRCVQHPARPARPLGSGEGSAPFDLDALLALLERLARRDDQDG